MNLLRGTANDETIYDLKEDESAYGDSISGRSSMVSTLERYDLISFVCIPESFITNISHQYFTTK